MWAFAEATCINGRRNHSWPVNYPVVLGHEFGGHIVETGSRVKNWKEGERVVSETAAIINPDSPLSRTGLYNLIRIEKDLVMA